LSRSIHVCPRHEQERSPIEPENLLVPSIENTTPTEMDRNATEMFVAATDMENTTATEMMGWSGWFLMYE